MKEASSKCLRFKWRVWRGALHISVCWAQEVDLAITADMGTLQRLPGIVGHGKNFHRLSDFAEQKVTFMLS